MTSVEQKNRSVSHSVEARSSVTCSRVVHIDRNRNNLLALESEKDSSAFLVKLNIQKIAQEY